MTQHEEVRACDLCVAVFGDRKPKPTSWCSLCKRWFCADCRKRYKDRGYAAVKAFLGV